MAMASSLSIADTMDIYAHVKRHNSRTCEACINFRSLEEKQFINCNKLRIRFFCPKEEEDIKRVVFKLFNKAFSQFSDFEDLRLCEKRCSWDGNADPHDIVVTFRSSHKRELIYSVRRPIEHFYGNQISIIDELSQERVDIYKKAEEYFGKYRVSTEDGAIIFPTKRHGFVKIYTMEQLAAVIKSEKNRFKDKFLKKPTRPVTRATSGF